MFNYSFSVEAGNIYFLFMKFDDEVWRAKVREKIFWLYFQSTLFFNHFVYLLHPWVISMELLPFPTDGVYVFFDKLLE